MIAMFWFSYLWEVLTKSKMQMTVIDEAFITLNVLLGIAIIFALAVGVATLSGRMDARRRRRLGFRAG